MDTVDFHIPAMQIRDLIMYVGTGLSIGIVQVMWIIDSCVRIFKLQ
jgi:hypothetical protein